MRLSPALGFPSVAPSRMLNRMLGADPQSPLGWAILLAGLVVLATAYLVAVSGGLLRPGLVPGMLFGLALWFVTGGVLMPLMGLVSPDQPTTGALMRMHEASSAIPVRATFMMLHLGILAPVGALITWLLFGVVLGATSSALLRGGRVAG